MFLRAFQPFTTGRLVQYKSVTSVTVSLRVVELHVVRPSEEVRNPTDDKFFFLAGLRGRPTLAFPIATTLKTFF